MNKLRALVAVAAVAVAGVVVVLATRSSGPSDGSYTFDGATKVGTLIPVADRKVVHNFDGSLLDGGTYDLAQDKGKITVVNFWGTWCPPCVVETPQFARVYDQYKTKDVAFVGIDISEDGRDEPRAFVKNNSIGYPIVYDEDGRTALTLGNLRTQGAPYTVFLDSKHRVAAVYLQRLAPADLEKALNSLLAEKT